MEDFDIIAKYNELFGVEHRASLFDGDEQYAQLRQEIIDAPIQETSKQLPFERIKILPYEEFLRVQVVREHEERNIRTFSIRIYEGKKLVCYGAGYFNIKTSKFVVFKESFSTFNDYHGFLIEKVNSLNGYFSVENGIIKVIKNISFDTASLAASFVLGKSSTFSEWKDHKGKSLNSYYTRFRNLGEDSLEYTSVPNYVEKPMPISSKITEDEKHDNVSDGISRIIMLLQSPMKNIIHSLRALGTTLAPNNINLPNGKRIFMIHKHNRCYAYGYFDEETQYFYICKGSRVALEETVSYVGTTSSKARKRFLSKACTRYSDYYIVNKDAKCKSASAAACYALGDKVDYTVWKDALGYYLKDAYPKYFFTSGEKKETSNVQKKSVEDTTFHIVRTLTKQRTCNAEATYNSTTGKMTIKKGSIISLDVSSSFRYSVAGIKRLNIISRSCKKQPNGYLLISDVEFDSPNEAASVVTGSATNGWDSWVNSEGETLEVIAHDKI